MNSSLEKAKVGDYVAERRTWSGVAIYKISHVTPTQIITGTERWSKKNGRKIGQSSTYNTRFISVATEEEFLLARIDAAQQKVSHIKITAENLDAAETFIAITKGQKRAQS